MTSIIELIPVSEELIEQAAQIMSETEPNNSFRTILAKAEEFRKAGLTPVILHTKDLDQLFVTTQEMIDREYK